MVDSFFSFFFTTSFLAYSNSQTTASSPNGRDFLFFLHTFLYHLSKFFDPSLTTQRWRSVFSFFFMIYFLVDPFLKASIIAQRSQSFFSFFFHEFSSRTSKFSNLSVVAKRSRFSFSFFTASSIIDPSSLTPDSSINGWNLFLCSWWLIIYKSELFNSSLITKRLRIFFFSFFLHVLLFQWSKLFDPSQIAQQSIIFFSSWLFNSTIWVPQHNPHHSTVENFYSFLFF